MRMIEETPRPWRLEKDEYGAVPAILANQGPVEVCPARAHSLADAMLIVRAVNAYDDHQAEILRIHNEKCDNFERAIIAEATISRLTAENAAMRKALERAGYTKLDDAAEWKPPLGPSAGPLLDEMDRLRRDLDRANDLLGGDELLERVVLLSITFAQQQGEIAALRRALEFYADESNWRDGDFKSPGSSAIDDEGAIARTALATPTETDAQQGGQG
jgi:hypothetical protein